MGCATRDGLLIVLCMRRLHDGSWFLFEPQRDSTWHRLTSTFVYLPPLDPSSSLNWLPPSSSKAKWENDDRGVTLATSSKRKEEDDCIVVATFIRGRVGENWCGAGKQPQRKEKERKKKKDKEKKKELGGEEDEVLGIIANCSLK